MAPLLAALILTMASVAAAPMVLTSTTFEPVTTAASGQKTGVWVVNFCSPRYQECRDMQPAWGAVADELIEQGIYLAQVNADRHPSLVKRFRITEVPKVLMFRGGKMYSAPLAGSTEGLAERLRLFITEGYQSAPALPVPGLSPRPWDILVELHEYLGLGGMVLASASVVGMAAVCVLAVCKHQHPNLQARLFPVWHKGE